MSLEGGSLTTSTISNVNTHRDDRSTLKSPKSRSPKSNAQIQQKLDTITKQLAEVRLKRTELKKYDDGRIYGPKKDYTTVPKKLFSHPKLDFVYGEIMYSPYMTNPKDNYPKETYQMADTLKLLKHKNVAFKDLPAEEKPYDEKQLKKLFIREVCNYNPKFNIPKSIKSGTSSKPGTANSSVVNNRSTISTASSTTSLKETGSLRRRQLNKLNTRKHASATAMSLDASGFRPSGLGSGDASAGDRSDTQSPAEAMAEAIAKLAASAVATITATPAPEATVHASAEQPESPSRADDQAGEQAEDQYAEDFEGAAPAAAANGAGKEHPAAVGDDCKEATEEYGEEVYDADFEHTGVLPAEVSASQRSAPPAQSEKNDTTAVVADEMAVTDEYGEDFEVNAVPSGEEVSEEVASRTPAVKLTKQSTANSEIQEDMPSHASSVPSTVRSEIAEAPAAAAHASDFAADLGALEEETAGSTRSLAAPRAPALVLSPATDAEARVDHPEVAEAVLDEPLEEIMFVESKPGGEKDEDAAVRSNNYLNSPARGAKQSSADSNDVEEEGGLINIPSSSPGRNMDHPDEEIGEEYES